MLNRSLFIILGLCLVLIFSFNFYITSKKEAFNLNKKYNEIKYKYEYYNYLKSLFKPIKLDCKKENKIYICEFNKNGYEKIEKLFNSFIEIKRFTITSDGKKVVLKVEIE